jgi:anti-sigma regulatory factor (Ser/Thr protein kinase)
MRQAPRATTADGTGAWHQPAASLPRPGDRRAPIASSHHGHDLEHWPLHDTLVLGGLESAVPSARAHLRQLLRQWGHAELAEDASVVISELVTNAVVASADLRPAVAPVLMWLGSDRRHLLAAVADASPRPPMRLSLRPDAERGRGLALVEALTSRWGWHPASITGLRKFVWAEWHLPSGPASRQLPAHRTAVPRKPPIPPCRGGDHAGITRAWPWPQP